jgi:uncharacterized protein
MTTRVPLVDYLVLDGDNSYIVAKQCDSCSALFFNRRNACASCGGQSFTTKPLANTGTIRTFSIVHRAPKGISVPFVAAVVDLDGGGRVQANILDSDCVPEKVWPGMRVRMRAFDAGTDSAGTVAVGFGYELEKDSHV